MTVLEAFNRATNQLRERGVENPRLNAELLLAFCLKLGREGLYAAFRRDIEEDDEAAFEALVRRRVSGEPLQYLLGRQAFWDADLEVTPSVLIPRPDTEILVEQSLALLRQASSSSRPAVLEIGTGSGAVAVSLAKERESLFVVATDLSREALLVAEKNARRAGVLERIHFVRGDLFAPFASSGEEGFFDLILSNPPYVARPEIRRLAREVRDFEPIVALDGGEDGLDFYRRMAPEVPFYLRPGGWLLLELGQGQREKVSRLIEETGEFLPPEFFPDLSGIDRVLRARRKTAPKARRRIPMEVQRPVF